MVRLFFNKAKLFSCVAAQKLWTGKVLRLRVEEKEIKIDPRVFIVPQKKTNKNRGKNQREEYLFISFHLFRGASRLQIGPCLFAGEYFRPNRSLLS